MSTERTLMSWVRTAVALIGFGFTIFQFLDRLNRSSEVQAAVYPRAPWFLGMALIAAGTIGLIIAACQYRWMVRYLWSKEFKTIAGIGDRWHTPVLGVVIVLILIGLFAFAAVLLRI
jgi:putative membrane protein